ncbi:hypothetical protein GPECTOR_22g828 [Gonium pectorale]|uniref:Copper transport protein n=1 Tax=Gonium pectorale TaxID=33097 RepID=A0A150GHD2_GONPE|nr:hypothetical protein GPECTOR_22g828 [Gonium pectorale]|eukprot:KXZ49236.1 hypothetical protein GPECTOR_22g828 [Gonium pectorale]
MDGCQLCNGTRCDTPDPLLAYSAACTDMLMSGCEPWRDFCSAETAAAAQVLCLAPKDRTPAATTTPTAAGTALPPPADPCVLDSSQPSCKSYRYPDSAARADIDKLCGSMPDMPGCAVAAECEKGGSGVSPKYCAPFVLLATLCHDMPGMRGCEGYKALCYKAGSVVEQCAEQPAIPGLPTWSKARKAVFSACDDHPMAACSSCSSSDCPDPLASLAGICHEMPNMAVCADFWAFCNAAGVQDVAAWCAEDDSKYLPSMLMYFHQRTQELLLWKEWRPRTQGQYAGSVIAIVAVGVVATGLKTLKGALGLHWNHQRALLGAAAPSVTSIWLPRRGQTGELLIKAAITGVSLTLDYFNMLIAMTFNIGFFCAVIVGYLLGSLLFSHVLENYGAILHQRRKEAQARAGFDPELAGGLLPGSEDGTGKGPAAGEEGRGKRTGSTDEESEEQFRLAVEEGECNCVHSA